MPAVAGMTVGRAVAKAVDAGLRWYDEWLYAGIFDGLIKTSAGIFSPSCKARIISVEMPRRRLSTSDTRLRVPSIASKSCRDRPCCSVRNKIASTGSGRSIRNFSSSYFSIRVARLSNWSLSGRLSAGADQDEFALANQHKTGAAQKSGKHLKTIW